MYTYCCIFGLLMNSVEPYSCHIYLSVLISGASASAYSFYDGKKDCYHFCNFIHTIITGPNNQLHLPPTLEMISCLFSCKSRFTLSLSLQTTGTRLLGNLHVHTTVPHSLIHFPVFPAHLKYNVTTFFLPRSLLLHSKVSSNRLVPPPP